MGVPDRDRKIPVSFERSCHRLHSLLVLPVAPLPVCQLARERPAAHHREHHHDAEQDHQQSGHAASSPDEHRTGRGDHASCCQDSDCDRAHPWPEEVGVALELCHGGHLIAHRLMLVDLPAGFLQLLLRRPGCFRQLIAGHPRLDFLSLPLLLLALR